MLKNILLFLALLNVYDLHAQIVNCKMTGAFESPTQYKYAYLCIPRDSTVIVAKIEDGKFVLSVPAPKDIEIGFLTLDFDSTKTYKNLMLVKVSERNLRPKMMAIENAHIAISQSFSDSKVSGGADNKQVEDLENSIKTKDFKGFLNRYSDSKLAITLLRTFAALKKIIPGYDDSDPRVLYNMLSERLKKSKEGIKVFNELNL
ncbi:MAG: hypothetical protein J7577_23235 [Sphingobacteriaceae bacterium]|nr:hypothetical protein [Sphingobacteriaceae bacterium]